MVIGNCVDLNREFTIAVVYWNDETLIPGYCIDTVTSDDLVRLVIRFVFR
jgi:hypothetical protein